MNFDVFLCLPGTARPEVQTERHNPESVQESTSLCRRSDGPKESETRQFKVNNGQLTTHNGQVVCRSDER